jgi:hypothetical protein
LTHADGRNASDEADQRKELSNWTHYLSSRNLRITPAIEIQIASITVAENMMQANSATALIHLIIDFLLFLFVFADNRQDRTGHGLAGGVDGFS